MPTLTMPTLLQLWHAVQIGAFVSGIILATFGLMDKPVNDRDVKIGLSLMILFALVNSWK